jgi:hypothetical protein
VTELPSVSSSNGYLLFVSKPSGYELRERTGDPPSVGDVVEEEDGRLRVSKIGPSPLPRDQRPCVYLQPVT